MEVKVTGADVSDLAGGKRLVEPLHGRFPRLSLIWGDSHYGGQFLEWVKEHFGWDVQTVRRLGTARDESLIVPNPKTKGSAQGFTLGRQSSLDEDILGGSEIGVRIFAKAELQPMLFVSSFKVIS